MTITLTYVPRAWKNSVVASSVPIEVQTVEPPVETDRAPEPKEPKVAEPKAPEVVEPKAPEVPEVPAPVFTEVCETKSPIRMSSEEDVQIIKFDNLQFYILVGLFSLYILVVMLKSNSPYL